MCDGGHTSIPMNDQITLEESLRTARHVAILTGAGVSAESGIPTFRDKQTGLWQKYDALELATPEAFARNPALVWGWYEWRRLLVRQAQPNPAHLAIAALERHVPKLTLITQNVDDLHERAGSTSVLHLHGRLAASFCQRCRRPFEAPASVDIPEGGSAIEPPRCPECQGRVRPGVVWFGEPLPTVEWQAAVAAISHCDVFFCIGTSAQVQPAASLATRASEAGATTVQVNPNSTELDQSMDYVLRGPAGVVLPQLLRETWKT
jgi:NAD-dependent deacetylase